MAFEMPEQITWGQVLQASISLLIIAGHWFGINEAENIVITIYWFISALTLFVATLTPPSSFFANGKNKPRKSMRIMLAINVTLMYAAGWFLTATVVSISWIVTWVKRENWNSKQKEGS